MSEEREQREVGQRERARALALRERALSERALRQFLSPSEWGGVRNLSKRGSIELKTT
jgi:hypothetical protein